MKRFLLAAILGVGILSCGGEVELGADTELACLDGLAACEFAASRSSSSFLTHYIRVKECSYDYGACEGRTGADCVEACAITYVPTECELSCRWNTSTSTTSN